MVELLLTTGYGHGETFRRKPQIEHHCCGMLWPGPARGSRNLSLSRQCSSGRLDAILMSMAYKGPKMTSARWDEITSLLNDERRLQAEYPKVAEYLDMATNLSGTGDVEADTAFDLRFVHYMTGGSAVSSNPYWDIVEPFVSEHEGRRVVNGGRRLDVAQRGCARDAGR
jgi:hypothetical protein